jgi:hypothetical protein
VIRRSWSRTAVAILLGTALAAAIPALPAVSQQSPPQSPPTPVIRIGANATLQARGAAIIVPVRVTCGPGATSPGFLSVQVSQRVGNQIAVGFGFLNNVTCNGETRRVRVPTLAQNRPFRVGVAFGVATLDVCFPTECVNAVDFREFQVVRRQ